MGMRRGQTRIHSDAKDIGFQLKGRKQREEERHKWIDSGTEDRKENGREVLEIVGVNGRTIRRQGEIRK